MTIQEMIDGLYQVPIERRGERFRVYISGGLSGFLETQSIHIDKDKDFISVTVEPIVKSED